ncbi:MAG: hypothetical protein QM516_09070 [Limnohabitans sp.]|nr:hypothetical protein [Limnohabitans sp.]
MSVAPNEHSAVTTLRVREALLQLQTAVREAMAGAAQLVGGRPVDLVAAFGLDLKLAWKLSRIAQSSDPFAAVRHLPGNAGWKIAMDSMARAGSPAARIAAADASFEAAIRLGTAWAGDRKAFDMMAAGLAAGSDLRIDVEHRRQLYFGGSYVWGVRARLAMRFDVLGPAAKKGLLDCATVRGFVDLERLRADAAWQFEAPFVFDDRATKVVQHRTEPLESADAHTPLGLPLLPSLSSTPIPELRPTTASKGIHAFEIPETGVGIEGRFTIFQGSILRAVQPMQRSKRHHGIFQLFKQRTPVERAVFDLLVHESLLEDAQLPEAILYSDLHRTPDSPVHQLKDRLPAGLGVESLGSAARRNKLEGFDDYAKLSALVFEKTGWKPAEFRAFRVAAPYPPVPSTLVLEMQIAD